MASYFDTDNDTGLLHPTVASHADLVAVAAKAEADVIASYTVGTSSLTVCLTGYEADADDAEANVKDALKRTVADVLSHRLLFLDLPRGATGTGRGARSQQYAHAVDPDWPDGWEWRLDRYDYTPVAWYA